MPGSHVAGYASSPVGRPNLVRNARGPVPVIGCLVTRETTTLGKMVGSLRSQNPTLVAQGTSGLVSSTVGHQGWIQSPSSNSMARGAVVVVPAMAASRRTSAPSVAALAIVAAHACDRMRNGGMTCAQVQQGQSQPLRSWPHDILISPESAAASGRFVACRLDTRRQSDRASSPLRR